MYNVRHVQLTSSAHRKMGKQQLPVVSLTNNYFVTLS